ncbi:MAG: PAS domain S-box protein [Alphaproteobacteria bacterium]
MKLDHSEFIARHHTAPHLGNADLKKESNDFVKAIMLLGPLCLVFFVLAKISPAESRTEIIEIFSVSLTILLTLTVWRFYRTHIVRQKELSIIREVLSGSRGARLITSDSNQTVYYNDKFERLCRGIGAPGLESLIGLFHKSEQGEAHFRFLSEQAGRGVSDSVELFSKYGERDRWYVVNVQPVAGYMGYVHWRIDDVTQKHAADRALMEEHDKLLDFTDNAPVGFFSVDEVGRFIFANGTFARWIGMDLKDLLDQGYLHTCLADVPDNIAPYELVANNKPRQIVEVRLKGPAGQTFQVSINQIIMKDAQGTVRTRAVVHDLTAEREMRRALKASEDKFRRFFEEAPLGIVQADAAGRIEDCNSAFAAMLGLPLDSIEKKNLADFICKEDQEKFKEGMKWMEQGESLQSPLDITLEGRKNRVTTQMHARKFRESGNIVLHFIDMTERKSLEFQFVQSQKMQAIGQLAGGIAHDFNNLLTAMIGFCDLLLLRHKPGDPSFFDIMQIKQNSNRAANLVRQLLAFSRQQTLRPKVQDITDILTELSHLLRRLIGAGITLELVHGHELGLVKVDEGQMEQVLINLAVNARDAMDSAGSLSIMTENFTNRTPLQLVSEVLPPGHWVCIVVKDTGRGIPLKNMPRIFEPFYTTKEVGHGTGLGLATVYGIVRQTGGFLDVKSKVDKGTTFTIYLPRSVELSEVQDDNRQKSDEDSSQDLTGTGRIMLVEDEDAVRTFSQRALTNKGYKVLSAEGGEVALALLEKEENITVDLLITDVVMPVMDGPTLAKKLREKNPDLKIIFISGYTEDKLKDYMGKNTWFLPKPFTLKQLAAKVKEALAS